MKRVAATALLAMGLLHGTAAVSQDSSAAAQAAAEQARAEAARQLKATADEFTVVSVEPRQWSDSSLGCRKPGAMYLDVISEGYIVVLERAGSRHQVNVAGSRAVMCDQANRLTGTVRRPMNARGLDVMMERARQDLAQRLGADPAKIRLAGQESYRWDDSGLGCPRPGEALRAGPVDGFKLSLKYAGRTYTYHTDRQDVRPCPAIEAE
ncbi:MAG TPA: hypothetical protein VJT80_22495 [Steroidobacteraceae bacterium]|nr:hypothetical protein [Steroidobacteraceae bacterium]